MYTRQRVLERELVCPERLTFPAAQAFEYLQLPFAIVSATVGKLELQARRAVSPRVSRADTNTLF